MDCLERYKLLEHTGSSSSTFHVIIMGATTESQRRIDALGKALRKMKTSTSDACVCCDQLTKRARQLDSLTSPASDASSLLSKASNNLGATLVLMNEAREKFDTIRDCEPAIERLKRGVLQMQNEKNGKAKKARRNPFEDGERDSNVVLSEQDVYAAADSMEIIRDAYEFFVDRKHWRSTAPALASLERVHQMGVSSMCTLASIHLMDSGQATRIKRVVKQEGEAHVTPATETAIQVRTQKRSYRSPLLLFSPCNLSLSFFLDSRSIVGSLAES